MLRLPFLDFFAVLRLLTFLFSWTQTPRGRRGGDKTTSVRARARLVPEQDERGQSKGGEAPISKEVSEPHLSLPTVFAEKPGRETRGHLPLGLLRGRSRRRRFLRAPLGHTESEGAQPSRDQPRGTVTRPQWKRWSPRVCVTSIPSSPHLAVRCNAQSRARSAGRTGGDGPHIQHAHRSPQRPVESGVLCDGAETHVGNRTEPFQPCTARVGLCVGEIPLAAAAQWNPPNRPRVAPTPRAHHAAAGWGLGLSTTHRASGRPPGLPTAAHRPENARSPPPACTAAYRKTSPPSRTPEAAPKTR